MYDWIEERRGRVRADRGRADRGRAPAPPLLAPPPLIIGVQGVQGCGKTTVCRRLQERFAETGRACATLSLDDFYKPSADLLELARRHADDPRLQGRGNPGTHDIDLLLGALRELRRGEATRVPVFDKALRGGLGDRSATWRTVAAADVVLVEGWCLGFVPASTRDVVDRHVASYARLHDLLDGMIVLDAEPERAYEWREAAERKQGNGLTPSQVRAMVDRCLPTYRTYVPAMRERWDAPAALVLWLEAPVV